MSKPLKKRPVRLSPGTKPGRKSTPGLNPGRSPAAARAFLARNPKLIDQVRQIIAAAPAVRLEKVGPLKKAVDQGTYEIDARKVANALLAELLLKR
jgi:flagellar biosynthesis anti-sigma factor FlgM